MGGEDWPTFLGQFSRPQRRGTNSSNDLSGCSVSFVNATRKGAAKGNGSMCSGTGE